MIQLVTPFISFTTSQLRALRLISTLKYLPCLGLMNKVIFQWKLNKCIHDSRLLFWPWYKCVLALAKSVVNLWSKKKRHQQLIVLNRITETKVLLYTKGYPVRAGRVTSLISSTLSGNRGSIIPLLDTFCMLCLINWKQAGCIFKPRI